MQTGREPWRGEREGRIGRVGQGALSTPRDGSRGSCVRSRARARYRVPRHSAVSIRVVACKRQHSTTHRPPLRTAQIHTTHKTTHALAHASAVVLRGARHALYIVTRLAQRPEHESSRPAPRHRSSSLAHMPRMICCASESWLRSPGARPKQVGLLCGSGGTGRAGRTAR